MVENSETAPFGVYVDDERKEDIALPLGVKATSWQLRFEL
jgi:hypothetical protein